MTEATPLTDLTPETLRGILQAAGYRVETLDNPDVPGEVARLRSATSGLVFDIRFANPLPAQAGAYADATFQAAFQVRGELPLFLVNAWNVTHRFARLSLSGEWLLLDMDVIALGGVLADNLRAHVEIWDRLVQQLIAYLRDELPKLVKAAPVAEPAPEPSAAA